MMSLADVGSAHIYLHWLRANFHADAGSAHFHLRWLRSNLYVGIGSAVLVVRELGVFEQVII